MILYDIYSDNQRRQRLFYSTVIRQRSQTMFRCLVDTTNHHHRSLGCSSPMNTTIFPLNSQFCMYIYERVGDICHVQCTEECHVLPLATCQGGGESLCTFT